MKLNELRPKIGATKRRKRIGRGDASGHGGTSTKGHKGQLARAGGSSKIGFEGGQMPLQRRLPKRGFTNIFRKEYAVVNVSDLERFEAGTEVTWDMLRESGLVGKIKDGIKVLGNGNLTRKLTVRATQFSESARQKIEQAGGRAEVI